MQRKTSFLFKLVRCAWYNHVVYLAYARHMTIWHYLFVCHIYFWHTTGIDFFAYTWHMTHQCHMSGIYHAYTWHMMSCVICQTYPCSNIYGNVRYQSRTWIDMASVKHMLGIHHVYPGTWLVPNIPIYVRLWIRLAYDTGHHIIDSYGRYMPGICLAYDIFVLLVICHVYACHMNFLVICQVYAWHMLDICLAYDINSHARHMPSIYLGIWQ